MRKVVVCGLIWMIAGCAGRTSTEEPDVIGAPEPEPQQVRRETPDSTVWRTPFAVQHRGDRPQRQQRPRVVQVEAAPDTVVIAAAPPPAEEPPVAQPPVEQPARPAPRQTNPPAATPRPATTATPRPAQPARATPTTPARTRTSTLTHLVVKGDTLFSIARRYGISVDRIKAANNLEDDTIKLGQTLTIPVAT